MNRDSSIPRLIAAGMLILSSQSFAFDPWSSRAAAQEVRKPDDVRPAALADQNWRYFWANHLGTWDGRWTRYAANGEVVETFRITRDFQRVSSDHQIKQVNKYLYVDGLTAEKTWSFNSAVHSQADGFAHPASISMRGLAFKEGAAAWLMPRLHESGVVSLELFLVDGQVRTSLGVVYGSDRKLHRTFNIREDQRGYPGSHWSEDVYQVTPWRMEGKWQGIIEIIRPDLSRTAQEALGIIWPASSGSNKEYHFPDQIVLSCPLELPAEKPFTIAVRWLDPSGDIQIVLAKYDENAELDMVLYQRLMPTASIPKTR